MKMVPLVGVKGPVVAGFPGGGRVDPPVDPPVAQWGSSAEFGG